MPDDLVRGASGSLITADKLTGTSVFSRKGEKLGTVDHIMLEAGPYFERLDDFRWTKDYGRTVDKYYGAPPYWP